MIKQEMVVMLHHDAVYSPTLAQQGIIPGSKKPPSQKTIANQAQHLGYLENHRYEKFSQNDIEEVGHRRMRSKNCSSNCYLYSVNIVENLLKRMANKTRLEIPCYCYWLCLCLVSIPSEGLLNYSLQHIGHSN